MKLVIRTLMDGMGREGCTSRFCMGLSLTSGDNTRCGIRTSLSALKVNTPYATVRIPANAIAVFVFQFVGRVHQPPENRLGIDLMYASVNSPAGDQTSLG